MITTPLPWEEAAQQSQTPPWEEAAAHAAASTPAVNAHPDMPLLTSQAEATKYGLTQAAKGVGDVAVGIYNLAKPAQTTGESVANYFGPGALPVYRTVQGLYELAKQSTQVPGAIRDLINAPEGAALNALAQAGPRAGGQGAAQFAMAGASKLPVGRMARTAGTTLQDMAKDIPVVRQLAKVGENWANSATKTMRPEGAPVEAAVPENATQNVPLPNVTPTKASLIDPYRQQTLPAMTKGISGNVEAHAYDPATQTMVTHFKSGDIYKYEGVPPKVYDQFVNDSSQGSFHYNNIRGRYTTTKIGKVAPTKTAGQQVKSALSK